MNYGIYFSYPNEHLGKNEDYEQKLKKENHQTISKHLVQFLIVGLYSSLFSVMESRFRLFYNYLINSEEKGQIRRAGNISKISERILEHLNFSNGSVCIKLFTKIRNTIHNNGVYSHDDETIMYKGKLYKFEKGKPPNYGDPIDVLILEILPDIMEILDKLIFELLEERVIEDPFAKNYPSI